MIGAVIVLPWDIYTGLAMMPARYLLEPHGPLEHRDRNPQWVQDLRGLNAQIGEAKAVIFNVAFPVEAMFYTPYVVYDDVPTASQVQELRARGYAVFLFHDGSHSYERHTTRRHTR